MSMTKDLPHSCVPYAVSAANEVRFMRAEKR